VKLLEKLGGPGKTNGMLIDAISLARGGADVVVIVHSVAFANHIAARIRRATEFPPTLRVLTVSAVNLGALTGRSGVAFVDHHVGTWGNPRLDYFQVTRFERGVCQGCGAPSLNHWCAHVVRNDDGAIIAAGSREAVQAASRLLSGQCEAP